MEVKTLMKHSWSHGIQKRHKINVVQEQMTERNTEHSHSDTDEKRVMSNISGVNLKLLGKTERPRVAHNRLV